MRKLSFIFASLLLVVTMYAQDLKAIKLSSPDKNRGSSVMKALSDRHSDREYAARNSVYRIYRIYYGQQTGLTARTENERLPQR